MSSPSAHSFRQREQFVWTKRHPPTCIQSLSESFLLGDDDSDTAPSVRRKEEVVKKRGQDHDARTPKGANSPDNGRQVRTLRALVGRAVDAVEQTLLEQTRLAHVLVDVGQQGRLLLNVGNSATVSHRQKVKKERGVRTEILGEPLSLMATLAILLLSRSMMPFMISALDVRRALFLVRLSWYRSVSSTISSPMISLKVRRVRLRKQESVIRVGEEARVSTKWP